MSKQWKTLGGEEHRGKLRVKPAYLTPAAGHGQDCTCGGGRGNDKASFRKDSGVGSKAVRGLADAFGVSKTGVGLYDGMLWQWRCFLGPFVQDGRI